MIQESPRKAGKAIPQENENITWYHHKPKMLANISWQTTQKSAKNGQLLQRRRGIFAIANGNDADRLVSLLANRTAWKAGVTTLWSDSVCEPENHRFEEVNHL